MLTPVSMRAQAASINFVESAITQFGRLLQRWSPTRKLNGAFTAARRILFAKESRILGRDSKPPEAFFIKCYSPEKTAFRLQLEVATDAPVYRTSIEISPGWNEHYLNADEMISVAGGKAGVIRISVENDREVRLIFTWLDFVCLTSAEPAGVESRDQQGGANHSVSEKTAPAEKIKCVAWDLDNTLWHGVIGDAGTRGVVPDQEMLGLIPILDERGILQTIVSKNNFDAAWAKITELGLEDHFLFPAIHWGPKSLSIQQIAKDMNINVDTFAVIDDSPFERHEIQNLLPQVRVFDPADGPELLKDAAFDVPVTDESRGRRLKYLTEAKRRRVHQAWRGDYDAFLKSCHMILQIRHPAAADYSRCVELLQRSNQFNLSGRAYDEDEFGRLMKSTSHDCYCLDVADDFGGYGIVGFAAFESATDGPTLVDFVLSCRVAQKMVEVTFLNWYSASHQAKGCQRLRAQLRVTSKNAPLRDVLQNLGFMCVQSDDDSQLLELRFNGAVTIPDVITIRDQRSNSGIIPASESSGAPSGNERSIAA